MKFFPVLSILIAVASLFSSCTKDMLHGSGDKKIELRSLPAFNTVHFSGIREAEIILSDDSKVELSGYVNLVNNMEARVINGHLYFSYPNHYNIKNDNVKLRIFTNHLDGIYQSGETKVKIGAGYRLDLLTVYLSGNSHLEIGAGVADRLVAEGSGTSKIFARSFQAKKIELELSGDCYAEASPLERLKVNASGKVRVKYWGNPVNTDVQTSGEARVEHQ